MELLNGAVVQRYNGQVGSVMISDPRWYYDPGQNILVIPWINITADSSFAVSGISTVQMAITEPPQEFTYNNPGTVDISYGQDPNVHPLSDDLYRTAWSNYLTGSKFGMAKISRCVLGQLYLQPHNATFADGGEDLHGEDPESVRIPGGGRRDLLPEFFSGFCKSGPGTRLKKSVTFITEPS